MGKAVLDKHQNNQVKRHSTTLEEGLIPTGGIKYYELFINMLIDINVLVKLNYLEFAMPKKLALLRDVTS